jgi:hypothetical protein
MYVNIKRKRKPGYRVIKRWGRVEEDYSLLPDAIKYQQRVKSDGGTAESWYCLNGDLFWITKIPDTCASPYPELLYNWTFDCGLIGWHFSPSYSAILKDNGDGSINLEATSKYGSVIPDDQVYPYGSYRLTVEVDNVSGNGKMSIRNQGNVWFNLLYFTAPGVYTVTYTGDIKEIHCGASNDEHFKCDFLSYSLKEIKD